jgi:hypothetical protein
MLTLAALPGCGDDAGDGAGGGGAGGASSTSTASDGHSGEFDDVVFEGEAQHDALEELLAATVVDEPSQASSFTSPEDGAALDPAAPPTFAWTPAGVPRHGDPVNGAAYYLVFSTSGQPSLLRVFTTEETYAPDAEAWAAVTAPGTPVIVTITSAVFEQNRVAQGGGPWVGPTITLGG